MPPEQIRAARLQLGLTQAQFGDLLGAHWVTVSRWERGELTPTRYQVELLERFAVAGPAPEIADLAGILAGAGVAAALLVLLDAATGRPAAPPRKAKKRRR